MTRPALVRIDPRAAAAYGVEGVLPVGAILVLPGGVVVRVALEGALDELRPGGSPRPGIAYDPTATRRR